MHNQRFFSYLSLFTFFMLFLVSGGNFFVMFVGLSWPKNKVIYYNILIIINYIFTNKNIK